MDPSLAALRKITQGGAAGGRGGRGAPLAVDVASSEFPSWVRDCDKDFKEKACALTHEGRTLLKFRAFVGRLEASGTNPFRRAARHRCGACEAKVRASGRSKKLQHNYSKPAPAALLETEGCTCHVDIYQYLPDLDTHYVPVELLAPSQEAPSAGRRKREAGAGGPAVARSLRVKTEPGMDDSEAAENIFGFDAYGSSGVHKGEADEGEGGADKEGKEDGDGRRAGDEAEDDDEQEEEDLELDDYENAGERCDDDEDLVDEGAGSDEDEEARYGTF